MPLKVMQMRTFNPVCLAISKWRTFKLVVDINLHQSTWAHKTSNADRSSNDEQLFIKSFL
jgi:hypothetical protein